MFSRGNICREVTTVSGLVEVWSKMGYGATYPIIFL